MDNFNGTLSGAGFINKTTVCSILTNEMDTLPELHGDSHVTFETPHMFVPDKASIITDHEVRLLHEITTAPVKQLNPYPTAFPYGNGMVLHFYQQQESSTTKTVHKVINKGLKAYV